MPEQILSETTITSGVALVAGSVTLRGYNISRQSITIQNLGTGTLYLGGSLVTTSNGIQVVSGGYMTLDKSHGAAIYCVSAGTCDVRFLEEIV